MERLRDRALKLEDLLKTVHHIANRMQAPARYKVYFTPTTIKGWGAYIDSIIDESGLLNNRAADKDGGKPHGR